MNDGFATSSTSIQAVEVMATDVYGKGSTSLALANGNDQNQTPLCGTGSMATLM